MLVTLYFQPYLVKYCTVVAIVPIPNNIIITLSLSKIAPLSRLATPNDYFRVRRLATTLNRPALSINVLLSNLSTYSISPRDCIPYKIIMGYIIN